MQILANIRFDRINSQMYITTTTFLCTIFTALSNMRYRPNYYWKYTNTNLCFLLCILFGSFQPLHIYRKRGHSHLAKMLVLFSSMNRKLNRKTGTQPLLFAWRSGYTHSAHSFWWSLYISSAEWSDNKFRCTTASDSTGMGCSKSTLFVGS